jgi:hypothetical protein
MCGPAYQTRVENGSVTQRFQMGGNGFHLKPDPIEADRPNSAHRETKGEPRNAALPGVLGDIHTIARKDRTGWLGM